MGWYGELFSGLTMISRDPERATKIDGEAFTGRLLISADCRQTGEYLGCDQPQPLLNPAVSAPGYRSFLMVSALEALACATRGSMERKKAYASACFGCGW